MKRNTMAKLACVLALACMWCAASSVANAWDSAPQAGTRKVLTVDGVEYAFRYCPAGGFTMRRLTMEVGREQRNATLRNDILYTICRRPQWRYERNSGFWMLETEVTQEMWQSATGANPSWFSTSGGGSDKVSGLDTSRFPAENVSWYDCQTFVNKLNALRVAPTGFAFRLPWGKEWEYACRAGTTEPYDVDGSSLDALGWYGDNSDERTHSVGAKTANAWGFYDMRGNVSEWCAEAYSYGGCWRDDAELCRSAEKVDLPKVRVGKTNGVRIVLASYESLRQQQEHFSWEE